MTHIFKPGDRAYWLVKEKWIELVENTEKDSYLYPLFNKDFYATFTAEGRRNAKGGDSLLPLNPYDPCDPLNPPEFCYPFMLNGKPVKIGDKLVWKVAGNPIIQVKALKLAFPIDSFSVYEPGTDCYFSSDEFCWPDELPVKKKVADWVYTYMPICGEARVEFAKGLTAEEVIRLHGAFGVTIRMIPGTEREVEG